MDQREYRRPRPDARDGDDEGQRRHGRRRPAAGAAGHGLNRHCHVVQVRAGEQRRAVAKRRGKKDGDALTEEDLEYLEAAGLARAVSKVESMKGLAEDGKEIGNDEQAIAAVLKKYDWLLEQVLQESASAVNFCS